MPVIQSLKLQRVLQSKTLRIREKGQTLSEKKETNIKDKSKGKTNGQSKGKTSDKSKGKSKGVARRIDTL